MDYPLLRALAAQRQTVEAFGGIDHRLRIPDGALYDMRNLSSDGWPVLTTRQRRAVYASPQNCSALMARDCLCWVDGSSFVIGGCPVELGLSTEEPKHLVSMGAYVLILPDGIYVNTADWDAASGSFRGSDGWGKIDNTRDSSAAGFVKCTLCRPDGTAIHPDYTADPGTSGISGGAFWLDQSVTPHVLRQYAADSGMWVTVASTYVRIESPGIGVGFSAWDGVTLSWPSGPLHEYESGTELQGSAAEQLQSLSGAAILQACSEDAIVVTGMLDGSITVSDPLTVSRQMPLLDYVTESGNRLWGCRFGLSREGKVVNEIYASKLGDFKNWSCFAGISTDSYTASVGSDGPFTGAITHLGYPLFFKEGCVHKVYGAVPANFQIQTTACRGVQPGCADSLAIVDEVLYYKSRHGVCAYDGSLPVEISAPLGDLISGCDKAAAGGHGSKYYLSLRGPAGWSLFVYDAVRGLWHREDGLEARCFCSCGGSLYALDGSGGRILTLTGSEEGGEETISWSLETGELGLSLPEAKYVSRLTVRMALEPGGEARFFVLCDGVGDWEPLGTVHGSSLRSFTVPIRPRRCDHLRLRIEGEGGMRLYALTKTIEQGSEFHEN